MTAFTGSLQPKKKHELQEIANALDISENGTRDELMHRIKHHLGSHENSLSEDPRFAGLYGRTRKKSVQPQLSAVKEDNASVSSDDREDIHATKSPLSHGRSRGGPPPNDSVARVAAELDPANLPPLPPSPIPSAVLRAASTLSRDASTVMLRTKQQSRSLVLGGRKLLNNTQAFLSDANNIYSATLLIELAIVINAVFPVSYLRIPLSAQGKVDPRRIKGPSPFVLSIPYPTPASLLSLTPWSVLVYWMVPTLILPLLFGALISFSKPPREIDPLTVGIMRVACSVLGSWGVQEEILPVRWRVISAAVGAAFAFAEAVGERRRSQTI